jgi:hypothetical protein
VEHRRGAAEATIEATASRRVETSDQAISLTSGKADAAARRWLAESHVAKNRATLTLPPSRLALDATDIIALEVDGRPLAHRLDRIADGDARDIEATRTAPDLYLATDGPDTAPEPVITTQPGPIETIFLDLPLLRGDEVPHAPHIAAFAKPWSGAAVYTSVSGDDYRRVLTLEAPATIGRTATTLAASAPSRWSPASFDVILSSGTLLSANRLATLAGANAAAIETPNGWEVIQFGEAALIAPRTYRLSRLLRGQRGTDPLIADVPVGTRFVLLNEALKQLPITDAERGLARHIRVGPATRSHDNETYRTTHTAFDGVGLRPFAPAHLRAERDGDTVHLQWTRRTRIGGDRWDTDAPLAEEIERYRVTIEKGGTITIHETSVPHLTVTGSDQIIASVAQISASYGPGLTATITA